MYYSENCPSYQKRYEEWMEIEDAVLTYQKQFSSDASTETIKKSKDAAQLILKKFEPLIKKYLNLIKTGEIDYDDKDIKMFIYSFVSDQEQLKALKRKKQNAFLRSKISDTFNFIKESYGLLPDKEIIYDLNYILLLKAKKYKKMNRNFCSYLYNSYRYEVSRHIKKFLKDPINIGYKKMEYEDCINGHYDDNIDRIYEDRYNENSLGLPSASWLTGDCSNAFSNLSVLDRKIIVKYYLEEWKDKQIADFFGMHINTVNQRRRQAAKKIANNCGIDVSCIKRTRRSGKKINLPLNK